MAGRNFLFVPGPTNVPERIQRAMMVPWKTTVHPISAPDPCHHGGA
jgi:alanine-glyoxylate transaminase / serine-glyoxylate transaminase / serine-pyruvate transaminase